MGIPRLTQDLQQYLGNAVLSATKITDTVSIQDLVVDGPSMVYYVYGRLSSQLQAKGEVSKICDVPTYSLLNLAAQQFLRDIEACGVKIHKIFFDGALPKGKRQVRADRLERSRRTLELYRAAYPHFNLGQSCSDREVSQALWQLQPKTGSAEITAPFIVPSVLESLCSSKWSEIVSVVPGEADLFCAYEARQKHATVLTNDSDLVLFDGVETVVLLNSLTQDQASGQIQARCWRPQTIAEQLGIPSLFYFGFARAQNSRGSFNVVAQTAKELRAGQNDQLEDFRAEFDLRAGTPPSIALDSLDPRFAEVACQLSASDPEKKPEITLPMLLEDSNRDASWSYGKSTRQLAYSILTKHFTSLRSTEVIEHSRKGPAIASTTFAILAKTDLEQYSQGLVDRMTQYTLEDPCGWIMYAIHEVWSQRNNVGKSVFSAHILSILLGLAPVPIAGQKTVNMWDLMHLNANIQAVLYSTRLLKQAVKMDSSRTRFSSTDVLVGTLDEMPAFQKIFLTPLETRGAFGNLPREKLKNLLQPFVVEFDMAGILGISEATVRPARPLIDAEPHEEEFLVAGGKRKRRKKQKATGSDKVAGYRGGQNIFDVLAN